MPYQDVRITILNKQSDESGEEQTVKLTTEGRLYKRPTEDVLMYHESEGSGMGKTMTTVVLPHAKDEVVLTRIGDQKMKMRFVVGGHYETRVTTPFGFLDLGFDTQNLQVNKEEDRGDIRIHYSMDVNHQRPLRNQIRIQYEACRQKTGEEETGVD